MKHLCRRLFVCLLPTLLLLGCGAGSGEEQSNEALQRLRGTYHVGGFFAHGAQGQVRTVCGTATADGMGRGTALLDAAVNGVASAGDLEGLAYDVQPDGSIVWGDIPGFVARDGASALLMPTSAGHAPGFYLFERARDPDTEPADDTLFSGNYHMVVLGADYTARTPRRVSYWSDAALGLVASDGAGAMRRPELHKNESGTRSIEPAAGAPIPYHVDPDGTFRGNMFGSAFTGGISRDGSFAFGVTKEPGLQMVLVFIKHDAVPTPERQLFGAYGLVKMQADADGSSWTSSLSVVDADGSTLTFGAPLVNQDGNTTNMPAPASTTYTVSPDDGAVSADDSVDTGTLTPSGTHCYLPAVPNAQESPPPELWLFLRR